jgi:hypothetical protein
MTELSPAAQAVLDAFGHCQGDYEAQARTLNPTPIRIAAALRAAADQVVAEEPKPTGMKPCGDTYSAREIRRAERMKIREQFLAIANELDPSPR